MKRAIFLTVAIVLGVSCLPSRVRRQFDWDKSGIDPVTPTQQNGPTRWGQGSSTNGGQGGSTGWGQGSPTNGGQEDPTGWGQGSPTNWGQGSPTNWGQGVPTGYNPGIDGQNDNIFSDPNYGTNTDYQGNNNTGTNINQGSGNGVNSTTPAPTTTPAPPGYLNCMKQCPRIKQYSPVCGTDNIVYWNIMELRCAVTCGRTVEVRREGTCAGRRTQITNNVPSENTSSLTNNSQNF